ncbi:hypothetical protein DYB31_006893 [Aphanomyces astaci]|uniref:Uncharacterized protein n=3 Tax=Aphanomyces astaci TaxID=112090 RepID=A0A397FDU9_APHAT|nr:hypothetical protein DYB31_006893 [Aphanomyces astaci]
MRAIRGSPVPVIIVPPVPSSYPAPPPTKPRVFVVAMDNSPIASKCFDTALKLLHPLDRLHVLHIQIPPHPLAVESSDQFAATRAPIYTAKLANAEVLGSVDVVPHSPGTTVAEQIQCYLADSRAQFIVFGLTGETHLARKVSSASPPQPLSMLSKHHSKRKASTSVPAQSEPPVGKHATTNTFTSHILYSKPIVLDDFHRSTGDVPPLHDPNGILGDMTRHMSGLSLASMDSPAEEYYRASFTSDRSLYAPDSTRSALISERSSSTALNSSRSSMPLSDFLTETDVGMVASTPRRFPTPIVPKDERPAQPDEERDFYEKQWMLNFQHSTVQTTVVPDTVYIPPGEQGQLVRISGYSLASGAKVGGPTPKPSTSSNRPYVVFRLEVEGYRIPSLPSRQLSIRRSFAMAFLRKRQGDLEGWLQVVLSIPAPSAASCSPAMTPAVRMFLIKEANQPPALETGTQGFSYNEPETTKVSLFAALQMTPPQPSHHHNRSLTRSGGSATTTTKSAATKNRHATLFLHQTEPTKPQKRLTGRSVDDSMGGFNFLSKSSSYADSHSMSSGGASRSTLSTRPK